MAVETKVSKGYLTVVPKEVRRAVEIREGDILVWELKGGQILVRPRRPLTLADITGLISRGGDAVQDKKRVQGLRRAVR